MRKFAAGNGENGGKRNKAGKDGEDLIIKVPEGTVIIDEQTGRVVADLHSGTPRVILKGGRGGKGNARFTTPTRQTPSFALPGRKTLARKVILELKSIADVGLVGFPSVGKSTLLRRLGGETKNCGLSFYHAFPEPWRCGQRGQQLCAGRPARLIEGASQGAGLGHDFLRHIERTRMILHVVDASGIEGRDPVEDYYKIREELRAYSPELAERKEIVAAAKMDLPGGEVGYEWLREELEPKGSCGLPHFCGDQAGHQRPDGRSFGRASEAAARGEH